jgi:hypothetical protein
MHAVVTTTAAGIHRYGGNDLVRLSNLDNLRGDPELEGWLAEMKLLWERRQPLPGEVVRKLEQENIFDRASP